MNIAHVIYVFQTSVNYQCIFNFLDLLRQRLKMLLFNKFWSQKSEALNEISGDSSANSNSKCILLDTFLRTSFLDLLSIIHSRITSPFFFVLRVPSISTYSLWLFQSMLKSNFFSLQNSESVLSSQPKQDPSLYAWSTFAFILVYEWKTRFIFHNAIVIIRQFFQSDNLPR